MTTGGALSLAGTAQAQATKAQKKPGRPTPANMRLAPVGVDLVQFGPLQQTSSVIGKLVAQERGIVAARTPGPVEAIHVRVGDRVKKNDVLAELVTDSQRARMAFEKAELLLARQALARLEKLRSRSSAAFQQSRYDEAVQRVARAQANVTIASLALKYSRIRAPFDGVVVKRHTDAGAYLPLGGPVVTLLNLGNLEIEAEVPIDRTAGVQPGRTVAFTITGQRFSARVRAIIPDQNPLSRTIAVRFTPMFGDAAGRWPVNQSVTLAIPIGKPRQVVSVHKDAAIARGPAFMVYVLVPTGKVNARGLVPAKAVPRMIRIGSAVGRRFEVLAGLKPGDIVVSRGNERLRPGQTVGFRPPAKQGHQGR